MTRPLLVSALLGLCLGLAGCSAGNSGPGNWTGQPAVHEGEDRLATDPAQVFTELERLLLEARTVVIHGAITAEGAVTASLRGRWLIEEGNRVHVDVSGSFLGRPVKLQLVSDGLVMRGGSEQVASFESETAPALNEALILGFTRMGLLHNLAMLSQGEPPDRAHGGVNEWVEAIDFTGEVQNTGENEVRVLRFGVLVDKQPAADATFFVHPVSMRPLRRRQTVHFGEDTMRVTERYDLVRLGGVIDPAEFLLERNLIPPADG